MASSDSNSSGQSTTRDEQASDQRQRQPQQQVQRDDGDELGEYRDLSVGKIVAYGVGFLTIIAAIGSMFQGDVVAGIVLLIAGVFGIPPTRNMIQDEAKIRVSRWLAVAIWVILVVIAGQLAI